MNEKSTTLAVHIWTLLEGDNPNYEHACAIAIVILLTVLLLSISIKIVSKCFNKEKNNAV